MRYLIASLGTFALLESTDAGEQTYRSAFLTLQDCMRVANGIIVSRGNVGAPIPNGVETFEFGTDGTRRTVRLVCRHVADDTPSR